MSSSKKKLLLMGRSGSGKSSMRSIIFSNYSAVETRRLGATIDVEHSHVRFLGHMTLNLWDCGGQDVFMENYFSSQRDHIFRVVEVLIHVFDVESKDFDKDIETFMQCLQHLKEFSPDAKVFVLLHKMDLVKPMRRELLFNTMMKTLRDKADPYGFELLGFATSIWDESLYKAWSSIVCTMIPNMNMIERHLEKFGVITAASEVLLFEKATFLVVSQYSNLPLVVKNPMDPKRYESISNIIKTFKQSCSQIKSHFRSVVLHGNYCSMYIDALTQNTIIMVVMPPKGTADDDGSAVLANIKASRAWFDQIEQMGS